MLSLSEFWWKIKALPSTQITAWKVLVNSIASKANLERRGIVVNNNLCCFCEVEVETTRHLFCDCRNVWLVWN